MSLHEKKKKKKAELKNVFREEKKSQGVFFKRKLSKNRTVQCKTVMETKHVRGLHAERTNSSPLMMKREYQLDSLFSARTEKH